jgi:hypothetical protein
MSKPNWLISLENTVGSNNDSIYGNNSNTEEEEFKQACLREFSS